MTKLLELKNISKAYYSQKSFGQQNSFYAVKDVSLSLERGQCLGLVGESGCGKSSLARLAVGLLVPTSGEIYLEGERAFCKGGPSCGSPETIQMIFQDPFSSLNPKLKVGTSIAEALKLSQPKRTKSEIQKATTEALELVGLNAEHASRFPHEFSGGQRQRIAIARALITHPKVLVCDEPVSALDVSVQSHILNLMRDIQKERNMSYLFISHDLHVIGYMSDSIAVMYFGRIVEYGSREAILTKPSHPYTKILMDTAPKTGTAFHREYQALQGEPPNPLAPPTGCAFHPRCPYKKDICSERSPELRISSCGHQVACHFDMSI